MRTSKVYAISDADFINLVQSKFTYSDILRELGLGTRGGSSTDALKRRIKELNVDISHFNKGKNDSCKQRRYKMEEILVENSTYVGIERLKARLVNEGLLEYCCEQCGNTGEWLGKKLVLQLDHINGIHNDHRLENLRFLCPNCHSVTDTYAGKNKISK